MIYSIPPRITYGQEEMAFWDGFLSEEEINFILAQPEWNLVDNGAIGSASGMSIIEPKVRESKISWMTVRPELHFLWDKFAKIFAEVNRRHFHYDLTGFYEPAQLGIYLSNSSGHYDWHTDMSSIDRGAPRKLSMSLLLSDRSEFEGGEFQVKTTSDEARTLETKRGRAWFFPSYTLHRVTPVTKGVRRSLVLWCGGPAFK